MLVLIAYDHDPSIDTRVSCQTKHSRAWWCIELNYIWLSISISAGVLISSARPSDNLTLPYPYYLHFPHEIHTFNQDMGKFSWFLFAGTPPLPALSPGQSANQTPQSSPDFRAKYKMNQAPNNLNNRPDLLENENLKKLQVGKLDWEQVWQKCRVGTNWHNMTGCISTPVMMLCCCRC